MAGRLMSQRLYPQPRKYPCVPALTLRATGLNRSRGRVLRQATQP